METTRADSSGAWRAVQSEETVLFILTLMIGAIVGLVVVAFILLTENLGSRMYPAGGAAWRRLLIPTLGALVTGILLTRYFPGARGSGIPQTKTALFLRGGFIPFHTVLGKFFCCSASLASGIALGREGPSVQIGGGIASALGRRMGLSPANTKSLVPIGSAAALAAAFNTPIAAVLFTLEEVLGDLHARVLGAIVLSSATSWMVLHLLLGDEPLFHVPAYQLVHPVEFLIYAALGIAGGLVSVSFVKLLLWMRTRFRRLPEWTVPYQPVVGGVAVGLMGWFVPEVLGVGYQHASQALNGQMALRLMVALVALKLFATVTCYASGNAGGIFGPSLFIGAMLGGAVGGGAHYLLPDYTGSAGAYALVGMGTAFAGIVRVPLTSVIMIFEVTRDYSIIVPLMIANLISYFISSRLQKEPIYEALLDQEGIRLPPGGRNREELLTVEEGMRSPDGVLQSSAGIEQALAAADPGQSAWPVVDASGLIGIVTRTQLAETRAVGRGERCIGDLLPPLNPATRLNAETFPHVHPDHPLDTAMRRMAQNNLDMLPVVSRSDVRELVGILSKADALAAYGKQPGGSETAYKESRTPVALLAGLLAAFIVLAAAAGFLNHYYRETRIARAAQQYREGSRLMANDRYSEAIERFRSALSVTHGARERLALAQALEKARRVNEAEIYFREALDDSTHSGQANLGLARIAASRADLPAAISLYHKAIYGSWPGDTNTARAAARFELVDVLAKAHKVRETQSELLALEAEAPANAGIQKRLGQLLLAHGLPADSARVFRKLAASRQGDADAYDGIGEAELAQYNYTAAHEAFGTAIRLNPADANAAAKLRIAGQLLALDPSLRGLRAVERYARSRQLLEAALDSFMGCAASRPGSQAGPAASLSANARTVLLDHSRPRSFGDATEVNIGYARQLWTARMSLCGSSATAGSALSRLMPKLAK